MLISAEVTIEFDPDWKLQGNCLDVDHDLFFPERGQSTRLAKMYCWGGNLKGRIIDPCPVRLECLQYALEQNAPYGIWGGMSARERRNEKRARRARNR